MQRSRPGSPVVLVTGSGGGIGRASVLELAAAGCTVVASSRRFDTVTDLGAPTVHPMRLDVDDEARRAQAVAEVVARHGRIDAVVNNAGWGAMLAAEDTGLATVRRMLETNLVAAHDLARHALPHMRAQGWGRIVNLGSIAGHVPLPLMGAYCATKSALRALTLSMDMEVRRFGVRAVLVEPGVIQTGFGARSRAEADAEAAYAGSPYRPMYARWHGRRARPSGRDPRIIARCVRKAVLSARPRTAYLAPWRDAKLGRLGKRLLPDAWTMWALRRYFGG